MVAQVRAARAAAVAQHRHFSSSIASAATMSTPASVVTHRATSVTKQPFYGGGGGGGGGSGHGKDPDTVTGTVHDKGTANGIGVTASFGDGAGGGSRATHGFGVGGGSHGGRLEGIGHAYGVYDGSAISGTNNNGGDGGIYAGNIRRNRDSTKSGKGTVGGSGAYTASGENSTAIYPIHAVANASTGSRDNQTSKAMLRGDDEIEVEKGKPTMDISPRSISSAMIANEKVVSLSEDGGKKWAENEKMIEAMEKRAVSPSSVATRDVIISNEKESCRGRARDEDENQLRKGEINNRKDRGEGKREGNRAQREDNGGNTGKESSGDLVSSSSLSTSPASPLSNLI